MQKLPQIMRGASPRLHVGNEVGIVVCHGFMASPGEVNWMADALIDAGYTVYVVRLPGHGIDPTHASRMRWEDWYAHVVDGVSMLRGSCDKVIVMGHSMGGVISSLVAGANDVDGLIIAASPFTTPAPIMKYAQYIKFVRPYTLVPTEPDLQKAILNEQEKRGEEKIGRVNYSEWSSSAVHELYEMILLAHDRLPQITAPTFLLYARQDDTVPLSDLDLARERISSERIESHIVEEGGHIVFQQEGKDEAFDVVLKFVVTLV